MDVVTASHAETEEAVCSVVVPIVLVRLKTAGTEVLTYARLDSCSTGTFVLEDVAACLDVKGAETKLMVRTANGTKLQDTKVLKGLTVTDLKGENAITLPKTYTKKDISASEVDIQAPELTRRWKYLNRIAECICVPSKLHGAKVSLLIRSNCPKDLEPMDILASANGGPYPFKTFAGWAIVGRLYMTKTAADSRLQ